MPPTIPFRSPPGQSDLASVMPAPAGPVREVNTLFAMSVRVSPKVAATVSAMAKKARRSRNQMLNLIIEAGIEAVRRADPS